uniref:Cytochrome P450 n=1 Tax=Polytomella parva TaxID=51329 RepID=A0A7S0VC43_9CHLO|mmetsp:Transcript_32153/g.58504  ORF Transcript_32153/g.58504 Transcript_32153/m.58504 type:complete len:681 (+) Transcript_32153:120-2162(+)|eukprot:CAMPEP_0175076162 /NCGR_PEP_ID=MMETSP0052_2-20121109/22539_1 /TAXON_ID=51329 ORGANISM="Polytomella parva, Strain SAG 63-3" /NCGR_SAMPLE_ID=MMETSP0052_2 /ASSEMBLY_ACC=CAM_ASM_000194 /LENGTH=680 /DNA_ID=CAMNT_0016345201 /DNA_START=15 /DNA_END=2057 /DNA_ORIENTATION=+
MTVLPRVAPQNVVYYVIFAFLSLIIIATVIGIVQNVISDRKLEQKKRDIAQKKPVLNPAPQVPGVPILGNVIGLARYGVSFLGACRETWGDVFTLNLGNQKMTFLCEPKMIEHFFKAPDSEITFRPAVEQFTQRVFGLPSQTFFPVHSAVLSALRNLLVPGKLADISEKVASLAFAFLRNDSPSSSSHVASPAPQNLFHFIRHWVFCVGVEVLFGSEFLHKGPHGSVAALAAEFWIFEEGFELAASPLPHLLQPRWIRARARLLTWLSHAYKDGQFDGTPVGDLVKDTEGLADEIAPNMILALLWASQANTAGATFWLAARLALPQEAARRRQILDELAARKALIEREDKENSSSSSPSPTKDASTIAAMISLANDQKSLISRCVSETVRLAVQSIDVRIAARELVLSADDPNLSHGTYGVRPDTARIGRPHYYVIPAGRMLAVCPYDAHRDERMYGTDAAQFNPDRADLKVGNGSAVMHSVAGLAYGGGPYRCPGRFFAEREVAILVLTLMLERDVSLTPFSTPSAIPYRRRRLTPQESSSLLRSIKSLGKEFFFDLGKGLWGISGIRWGLGATLHFPLGAWPAAGHAFAGHYPPEVAAREELEVAEVAGVENGAKEREKIEKIEEEEEEEERKKRQGQEQATRKIYRLPRPELRKLVGVKVPGEACMATLAPRTKKDK